MSTSIDYLNKIKSPNKATIEGVQLIDLKVHSDNRGWLSEIVRSDDDYFKGFGQLYIVNNFDKKAVRAFHMHLNQDEIFIASNGTLQFILVDERKGSSSYKEMNCFILDASRPQCLIVPRGIQHGSMALVEKSQIVALTNEPYNPRQPDEIRVPFDHYGDIWSVGGW